MTRVYVDLVAESLTAGHDAFLRAARAGGDELIAGLFSDDDCEWFDRRPAQPLAARARVVAASPHVDRLIAGVPVFPTTEWLGDHGIDRVVHHAGLRAQARAFWYRGVVAGMLQAVSTPGAAASFDPHGRTHVPAATPASGEPVRSRARRHLRRWWPRAESALSRHVFAAGLRRLADALRGTPIEGRYWIVGGLLLGWAREGRPLASDLEDADFAYLDEDHDRFLESVPALVRAGFRPRHRFSSADGRYVEHRFRREGVQYDFFRLALSGDRFRYSMFVRGESPEELIAEVPAQPRVALRYLGREWLKVADHDLALRSIYGDWRTERREWTFVSDRAIVDRRWMPPLPIAWDWPRASARGPGER